ncbi:MAG: hypothetical protein U1F11_12270 [Steroidobacteraceae bacterium]
MPNDEAPSHHAIDAPQAATGARGAAQRSFARDERGNPCVIDVWDAPARVFVHEDLSQRARELLPPQPVPWRQRLLWSAAFLLLRTSAGRAWLARRTGS